MLYLVTGYTCTPLATQGVRNSRSSLVYFKLMAIYVYFDRLIVFLFFDELINLVSIIIVYIFV